MLVVTLPELYFCKSIMETELKAVDLKDILEYRSGLPFIWFTKEVSRAKRDANNDKKQQFLRET